MASIPEKSGPFSIGSIIWPGASKVIEEAGELIQVLGKLIGTHGAIEHYDGTRLDHRLVEEVADLHAALKFFIETNNLTVRDRANRKLALFRKWHLEGRGRA